MDLVIVGGGLGGLLAAARARAAGRSVLVLEQAEVPGGLGRSPLAGKGEPLNLGPHAVYLDGPAASQLRALGVPLEGFSPTAGVHVESLHDGAVHPLPSSVMGLLRTSWMTWRERAEFAMAMREVLGGVSSGTLADWLDRGRSPRVRWLLAALSRVTTYTHAPGFLSGRLALSQMRSVLHPRSKGVLYVDGGWQTLVDALAGRVEVRTRSRVRAVAPGRVTLESGEVLDARDVALAVPLAAAANLSGDADVQRRLAAAVPVRAACLDLLLEAVPVPERRVVLGLDEPTYFSVHSRPEVRDNQKVHAAWYLAPDDAADARTLEARLEAFLDRVQPGWRERVVARRFFPSMRVMEDLPREETTTVRQPGLHLLSSVATTRFLFDAVAASNEALFRGAAQPRQAAL